MKILLLGIVLVLGFSGDARAQGFISPLFGYNFGGDAKCPEVNDCEDKSFNWGVGLGTMGLFLGFEEEFAYTSDFFGEAPGFSSSVLTLMSNVMIVPRLGPVRPYVLGGIGLIKTQAELTPGDLFSTDNNSLGWDFGGGVMILFGEHFGVRGDIRYFHSFQDFTLFGLALGTTKIDFGRFSGGVVAAF